MRFKDDKSSGKGSAKGVKERSNRGSRVFRTKSKNAKYQETNALFYLVNQLVKLNQAIIHSSFRKISCFSIYTSS